MTLETPKLINRSVWSTELLVLILAIVTIIALVSPTTIFTRTLTFEPENHHTTLSNDIYHGKDSVVGWIDKEHGKWYCETGNTPPDYCTASTYVSNEKGEGFDLSKFQQMTIWINYNGSDFNEQKSLILYLRNADESYILSNNSIETKYNHVFIPVSALNKPLTLDMEAFSVPDWWLSEHLQEPPDTEFNNIVVVELQTGLGAFTKEEFLQLEKIEWKGTLYSDEQIYKGLLIGWSTLILVFLLLWLLKLKVQLEKDKAEQQELVEINKILKLKNLEFAEQAKTDPLTGLLNRLGMRDALYDNVRNWKDHKIPFSLILLDIDHFKSFNDRFGHEGGDTILKAVSDLLLKGIRNSDCVARWGGEEFAILCRNTDLDRANLIAETLRKKLERTEIYGDTQITASFGVATANSADINDLFNRADQALYQAKNQGRNMVCINPVLQTH